ncbi:MAG TPA: ABC transporter substrate-binding protein [Desulfomonilaceae bacterium]|nr:ABC transporter substrate-binding protein [Desulfomonilaceae bacterium]
MRSKEGFIVHVPVGWKIALAALAWLLLIWWGHYALNGDRKDRPTVRMGYMPVITNLAAPILDYVSKDGAGIRFDAIKFASFAEMGEALRNGSIQAAFIIAPLSVVLHQQGANVRIVYIGNRHESTLVYRKDLNISSFLDLSGKTIAVPLRYSGHNICARRLAEQYGVQGSNLNIVEMNPPDMPPALASGALDAYFVGEPFAAKTVQAGESRVLYYVEQVWPKFICNLLLVKEEFIRNQPDRAAMLVQGAARSGYWAKNNTKEAAGIASKYWNQPAELVEYALQTPSNRIVFDEFVPKEEEIQFLADQMVKFKLLENNSITGLVDSRFAKSADLTGCNTLESILIPPRK